MSETCINGHPQTPENVRVRPSGRRDCLPCKRQRDRERKRASRAKDSPLALAKTPPETILAWKQGWKNWLHYQDEQALSLGDEHQEALLRLAYRHPEEYSELLEEVQTLRT